MENAYIVLNPPSKTAKYYLRKPLKIPPNPNNFVHDFIQGVIQGTLSGAYARDLECSFKDHQVPIRNEEAVYREPSLLLRTRNEVTFHNKAL